MAAQRLETLALRATKYSKAARKLTKVENIFALLRKKFMGLLPVTSLTVYAL